MRAQVHLMPTEAYIETLNLKRTAQWIQVTDGKTEDFWELSLPAKVEAGNTELDFRPIVQCGKRRQNLGPT